VENGCVETFADGTEDTLAARGYTVAVDGGVFGVWAEDFTAKAGEIGYISSYIVAKDEQIPLLSVVAVGLRGVEDWLETRYWITICIKLGWSSALKTCRVWPFKAAVDEVWSAVNGNKF